ncbi:MAG: hypothetical protein Q7S74_00705 [Nanoarchaeota archaeon]|nr:hypothetical protein [Nanoarchaeota archaeon]
MALPIQFKIERERKMKCATAQQALESLGKYEETSYLAPGYMPGNQSLGIRERSGKPVHWLVERLGESIDNYQQCQERVGGIYRLHRSLRSAGYHDSPAQLGSYFKQIKEINHGKRGLTGRGSRLFKMKFDSLSLLLFLPKDNQNRIKGLNLKRPGEKTPEGTKIGEIREYENLEGYTARVMSVIDQLPKRIRLASRFLPGYCPKEVETMTPNAQTCDLFAL